MAAHSICAPKPQAHLTQPRMQLQCQTTACMKTKPTMNRHRLSNSSRLENDSGNPRASFFTAWLHVENNCILGARIFTVCGKKNAVGRIRPFPPSFEPEWLHVVCVCGVIMSATVLASATDNLELVMWAFVKIISREGDHDHSSPRIESRSWARDQMSSAYWRDNAVTRSGRPRSRTCFFLLETVVGSCVLRCLF